MEDQMALADLISSVDIVDYISQYAEFEEHGGEFWCLSPLKEENTPSFSVRRETQQFYDFSSGTGGNIIHFIRAYHHCGFNKAVEILKEYAGIEANVTSELSGGRKPVAVEVAKRFASHQKKQKTSKHTILPNDYMSRYEKRDDKLKNWEDEGISRRSLDKFEVYYDSFSDRLVYPIKDRDGNIFCVSGRTLDPLWKEKKLRKYTYFQSLGTLGAIYGLFENRKSIEEKHEIILFEGAKSVMLADTWGFCNCGALLTSHLSDYQLKELVQLGCTVVFALDKDVDIMRDANIKRLRRYVNVYYVKDTDEKLEEKMSPVDAGRETWEQLYESRLWYR